MRVKSLRLLDFKRFFDLTLSIEPADRKIIALVGPNGSGKSSVFDAFEELSSQYKGRPGKSGAYYKKSMFDESPSGADYTYQRHVTIDSDQSEYNRTSYYVRTSYRYTAQLNVESIRKLEQAEADQGRPYRLIDIDNRLTQNYERLIGGFFEDVYGQEVTGKKWAQDNVDAINRISRSILDISITSLGNPVNGEGSLYFEKGTSKKFPFENLSSGEKEVIDIILDLYVKKSIYTNSVICIDEPELHLNTAIQRKLLIELEKLVPSGSQLWLATHSIGFLRALQAELWSKTAILDFTNQDFDKPTSISPIRGTRADWLRIFETAVEDLTGLIAPERIVYCEGRPDPGPGSRELGLDADVYNEIFSETHRETLFVSSGGGGAQQKNAVIGLRVLKKALTQVAFLFLKDRDEKTDVERNAFIAQDTSNRMLSRREIENYLFDKEVLQRFCAAQGKTFDNVKYDALVTDIKAQDLKLCQQLIQSSCNASGDIADFKRTLASYLNPSTAVYTELEVDIFGP